MTQSHAAEAASTCNPQDTSALQPVRKTLQRLLSADRTHETAQTGPLSSHTL